MKFRKKPVVVEAEQFFLSKPMMKGVHYPPISNGTYMGDASIVTIRRQREYLKDGDWIVAEPDGIHFYVVKDAIFQFDYEHTRDLEEGYDAFTNTTAAERKAMPKGGPISYHGDA